MNTSFLFSAALCFLFILVPTLINFARIRKHAIHYRLAMLGASLDVCIALFSVAYGGLVVPSFPILFALAAFCWLTGILFLSYLVELTSARRSRWYKAFYILVLALAYLSVRLPVQWGVQGLGIFGLVVCSVWACAFMLAWIRAATDTRARRDGEWMLLVFSGLSFGLLICFYYLHPGVIWLLAIWYFVMHVTVNHLRILQQLSDPENLLIIDNVFDIVIILDSAGRIIRVNRRGLQISGWSAGSINGNGIERLILHRELSDSSRKDWLDRYGWTDSGDLDSPGKVLVSGVGRSPSIDALFITKEGETIPVDMRILSLSDLGRERTGYIVSATDMRITHQLMKEISDREYAARDLALSESKFSRMFIFNPVGIMIVDLDTFRITEVNPAIEEIFERDGSMLAGKTLPDVGLSMTDMTYESFVDKIQMESSVPEFAGTIKLAPQRVRKCRLSAVTFNLNQTRNMMLSVSDVTQQERMREALERKQKVETVGILAGGIAHDFNNILAVILGHIGLAKMRIVDPHARMPVEKAEEACLRAREMTRQLLAFSRGGKPVIGICDTKQLIIDSAMLAVSDTSVACLFDIQKDIWPLKADKIQIGQVVSNLVRNSVDVMDKGGIIEIMARNRDLSSVGERKRPVGSDSKPLPPGMYVEIRIADQGPGIPDSIREKIFDPFFTTKEKGTGLGLAIVFSIIQNHAGSISVVSHEGEGAVFSMYLPADSVAVHREGDPDLLVLAGKKKVLLMDDDERVLGSASDILCSLGFDVTKTSNGPDAFRAYRDALAAGSPFDFCVLDLVIPGGMSGSDCAKAILDFDPGAVLFVSSGYSDDPVLAHYRDYGFRGIIPKPYTYEEFRQSLANVLVL